MLKTVQGVYRNGKIELMEQPTHIQHGTVVIVTFLERGLIDLSERGIDEGQAAELRGAMAAFAEDWDSPDMSIYNNYDANRADR